MRKIAIILQTIISYLPNTIWNLYLGVYVPRELNLISQESNYCQGNKI